MIRKLILPARGVGLSADPFYVTIADADRFMVLVKDLQFFRKQKTGTSLMVSEEEFMADALIVLEKLVKWGNIDFRSKRYQIDNQISFTSEHFHLRGQSLLGGEYRTPSISIDGLAEAVKNQPEGQVHYGSLDLHKIEEEPVPVKSPRIVIEASCRGEADDPVFMFYDGDLNLLKKVEQLAGLCAKEDLVEIACDIPQKDLTWGSSEYREGIELYSAYLYVSRGYFYFKTSTEEHTLESESAAISLLREGLETCGDYPVFIPGVDIDAYHASRPDGALMTDEQYVATGGQKCPFCESAEITGSGFEVDAGTATQEMSCNSCDAGWVDNYTLVGFT